MADVSINMLPVSDGLTDDGLLVVYQNQKARSIRGELIKDFAKEGVEAYVTAARNAAEQAAQAAKAAQEAADSVQDVTDQAQAAAQAALAAQQAQKAAETARQAAEQAAALAAQQAVENAENRLDGYVTDAQNAAGAAQSAAGNAASAVVTSLQGYLSAAEQARDDAQSAAQTAAEAAAGQVNEQLAQFVLDAQQAKAAAEKARDEAQAIAGGDFLERPTYDPEGRRTDIFRYVDNTVSETLGYIEGELVEVNGGSSESGEGTQPDGGSSGVSYKIGHGLKVQNNTLMVDSVSDFGGDNSLPATAALVQTTVGNIEILLSTI